MSSYHSDIKRVWTTSHNYNKELNRNN